MTLKTKIAVLKLNQLKVRIAAEGDASTSQAEGSPDGPHFTLKKIKREGFPEDRGVKEQVGMLKLASMDKEFAKYYLIDSHDVNGNGWGVTEGSIEQNIQSFVDMPFVITAKEWIENSEYEDQFDHPFINSNELRSIFAHQEKFRVGSIVKVAKNEDGKWYAMIKRNPKFAHLNLPPFCSPAIYQIDPHEPDGSITKWIGLHLAGLDRDPAYGARVALFKGTCSGSMGSCSHQFRMAQQDGPIKPVKQVGQSGLDITETDKQDSPFDVKKKEKSIKEASCACTAQLISRLDKFLPLATRISKLKKKKYTMQLNAEFTESEHPRDDSGQFTSGGGGSGKSNIKNNGIIKNDVESLKSEVKKGFSGLNLESTEKVLSKGDFKTKLQEQVGWQTLSRDERERVIRHQFSEDGTDTGRIDDTGTSKETEFIGDHIDGSFDDVFIDSIIDLDLFDKFDNPKKTDSNED